MLEMLRLFRAMVIFDRSTELSKMSDQSSATVLRTTLVPSRKYVRFKVKGGRVKAKTVLMRTAGLAKVKAYL